MLWWFWRDFLLAMFIAKYLALLIDQKNHCNWVSFVTNIRLFLHQYMAKKVVLKLNTESRITGLKFKTENYTICSAHCLKHYVGLTWFSVVTRLLLNLPLRLESYSLSNTQGTWMSECIKHDKSQISRLVLRAEFKG